MKSNQLEESVVADAQYFIAAIDVVGQSLDYINQAAKDYDDSLVNDINIAMISLHHAIGHLNKLKGE